MHFIPESRFETLVVWFGTMQKAERMGFRNQNTRRRRDCDPFGKSRYSQVCVPGATNLRTVFLSLKLRKQLKSREVEGQLEGTVWAQKGLQRSKTMTREFLEGREENNIVPVEESRKQQQTEKNWVSDRTCVKCSNFLQDVTRTTKLWTVSAVTTTDHYNFQFQPTAEFFYAVWKFNNVWPQTSPLYIVWHFTFHSIIWI